TYSRHCRPEERLVSRISTSFFMDSNGGLIQRLIAF
ncbi:MS4A4A isoform 5, partial [Pan troglodytes]